MNVDHFLAELQADPTYAGQIVYVHRAPAREARYAEPAAPLPAPLREGLARTGVNRLYVHQAAALDLVRAGRDVLITTGTASGKSLCYTLPALEQLLAEPEARALFLFPTKALCQDQFRHFHDLLQVCGQGGRLAGVFDGDTPSELRRRLRDRASVLFSNPDMLHAALMPQHARWAEFLGRLRFLVLDELHTYSGIFGSNMALLLLRLQRLCEHYGSRPRIVACSATIANPKELADRLTGRDCALVDDDGSPRGRKTYVLWNPPRVRATDWRSRRSANVEAHELMARLVAEGTPTITFSKAKMTAEMIYRYVCERLRGTAPQQVARVTPYRGGYLPEERRAIEARLFAGELLGVSTTPALELGVDVGGLDACIIVGYPGTRASFFQQAGRAGRRAEDSLVFLIGLDTSVNQYILTEPGYIFESCVEQAVIDPENPFVAGGHLRCAAHELPLGEGEAPGFGPHAALALRVLEQNAKLRHIDGRWYHAAGEVPQHEVPLRAGVEANVVIQDADTGAALGEVDRYDAPAIVHPHAIYMHLGETFRVLELDLPRNLARARRVEVDYYTQPLGGTDVHHIDQQLREKPFGTGRVCWGEVTAYLNTYAYEKIHFYSLDAMSIHGLDLPTLAMETMAFWIVPPEALMEQVRRAGLDAHSGLRGVGYATRMLLPLFMTCDTPDFSHTVGSVNSPWNAVFVFERYPLGLGFTAKAYERMDRILPAVLEAVRRCPCPEGCPCCVGKPLRQFTSWNVERGEASIPCKAAVKMILEGLLGDGSRLCEPDSAAPAATAAAAEQRLEQALRRRLERQREPQVFHPIQPAPQVRTAYPDLEKAEELTKADAARRRERRVAFETALHKRIAKRVPLDGLRPDVGRPPPPEGMRTGAGNLRPTDFPGRPAPAPPPSAVPPAVQKPVVAGDALAARARRRLAPREVKQEPNADGGA